MSFLPAAPRVRCTLALPTFMYRQKTHSEFRSHVVVEELEEIERHGVVAVIDGADDGLDGPLDVVDAGAEWAGALLGIRVCHGDQQDSLRGRLLHELELPQPGLPLLGRPIHHHILLHAHQQTTNQHQIKEDEELFRSSQFRC